MIEVRPARAEDDIPLARIDLTAWTANATPAPPRSAGQAFFGERTEIGDVLVAETNGHVVGYAKLSQTSPFPSHQHVLEMCGLAVDPAVRGKSIGRSLVAAVVTEAGRRGARKLALRVLAPNTAARNLYTACGFIVEGILRGEFYLDGQYVDDVLMALEIDPVT